jgi:hypothetical protein
VLGRTANPESKEGGFSSANYNVEEKLCFSQIVRVEAFGKAIVDGL